MWLETLTTDFSRLPIISKIDHQCPVFQRDAQSAQNRPSDLFIFWTHETSDQYLITFARSRFQIHLVATCRSRRAANYSAPLASKIFFYFHSCVSFLSLFSASRF